MTAPDLVTPPTPARRTSGVAIGLGVASLAVTLISALIVWGWTAFSSLEGNSSAGWMLLLLIPLGWLGVFLGILLGVVGFIAAIVQRASFVTPIIAVAAAVVVIVLGVALGYGQFLTQLAG